MSQAEHDRRIDYVEFGATDIDATKRFYSAVFGWQFTDYGSDYTAFHDGRLSGGFAKVKSAPRKGGTLVVIYAVDLEAMQASIQSAGGRITKKTFAFPGGRRFQFKDPGGNELAVWSDQ
ncbi:MAG: VOC family protein [Acidobacteria bacterium]|nr:VOC family protein [Acidobacteriota bacterium]MDA1234589.1 VOC family protein [Acidobacteriota bacterium]